MAQINKAGKMEAYTYIHHTQGERKRKLTKHITTNKKEACTLFRLHYAHQNIITMFTKVGREPTTRTMLPDFQSPIFFWQHWSLIIKSVWCLGLSLP